MLPQLDLILMAGTAAAISGIASMLLAVKLHRLFDTDLSFWVCLVLAAVALFGLASVLAAYSAAASALADACLLIAGLSAYAASRWLREQFEVVAGYDR